MTVIHSKLTQSMASVHSSNPNDEAVIRASSSSNQASINPQGNLPDLPTPSRKRSDQDSSTGPNKRRSTELPRYVVVQCHKINNRAVYALRNAERLAKTYLITVSVPILVDLTDHTGILVPGDSV